MDASRLVGPPSVARPLRLLPFRGCRLAPSRVGDPATARLFARHYRDVAERLERWRHDGLLLEDHEPALYVHEYTAAGMTVRGLVGALDISRLARDSSDGAVAPHEGIHPDQAADLADRMTTWQLNPAPILLVHRGPRAVRELLAGVCATPPRHEYVDRAEQQHRVWALPGSDLPTGLEEALGGSTTIIADGHHRYAAYVRMQQAAPGGAADRGLAMLVDQADTPLFLGAIHRVLQGVRLVEVAEASSPTATYSPVPARAFDALAHDTLLVTDGREWATIRLALSADQAAVEILHEQLLAALGARVRRVGFHHTVDDALARVRTTRGVAVLMPAPDFDLVARIVRDGRLLPEKATSFQPKPSVGVLIRSLSDG